MLKSEAELKWCPFSLGAGQRTTQTRGWSGNAADGNMVTTTMTAHNRNADGSAKQDCLCITEKCMSWVSQSDGIAGFCTKLDDNRQI